MVNPMPTLCTLLDSEIVPGEIDPGEIDPGESAQYAQSVLIAHFVHTFWDIAHVIHTVYVLCIV